MAKDKKTTANTARNSGGAASEARPAQTGPNPVWFKPVMFGFMLLGLVWIIVYYLSSSTFPVPALGAWNILVGFGIMFVGFLMTTRWR